MDPISTCMLMDYFAEGDLEDVIQNHCATFTKESIITFSINILNVLEFIHSGGFVNNDIKPENIVFMELNPINVLLSIPYIIDFGIAKKYIYVIFPYIK